MTNLIDTNLKFIVNTLRKSLRKVASGPYVEYANDETIARIKIQGEGIIETEIKKGNTIDDNWINGLINRNLVGSLGEQYIYNLLDKANLEPAYVNDYFADLSVINPDTQDELFIEIKMYPSKWKYLNSICDMNGEGLENSGCPNLTTLYKNRDKTHLFIIGRHDGLCHKDGETYLSNIMLKGMLRVDKMFSPEILRKSKFADAQATHWIDFSKAANLGVAFDF